MDADRDELLRTYPPEHFRQQLSRLTSTADLTTKQMVRPSKETIDQAIARARQGRGA